MSEPETRKGATVEEAASRLGIKPEGVHDLIAAGALQTSGSGDTLRITDESLLIYLASQVTSLVNRSMARPSRPAIAGDILLPILLASWFMAACVEVFSVRGGKPIVPVAAAIPVLAAVLAGLWWLARQTTDFSAVNGLGTAFYGRRPTPSGRVGTQWLVIAGVPLLPVRSHVILESGEPTQNFVGSIRTTKYRLRPLPGIHWPQALPILVGVWAGLAGLVALAVFK